MHGNYCLRLELADNFRRHGCINCGHTTHRKQQDVHITQLFHLFRSENMPQVSQVTY